jgi:hypothetical protein
MFIKFVIIVKTHEGGQKWAIESPFQESIYCILTLVKLGFKQKYLLKFTFIFSFPSSGHLKSNLFKDVY